MYLLVTDRNISRVSIEVKLTDECNVHAMQGQSYENGHAFTVTALYNQVRCILTLS